MVVSVMTPVGITTHGQPAEMLPEPSPWTTFVSARAAGGYKDNVTLAHIAPEASPFVQAGGDFILSHLPINGHEFNFSATADATRYLDAPSVDREVLAFVSSEYQWHCSERFRTGLAAEYLFQDQVLDVSTTETNRGALAVLGHSAVGRPGARFDFAEWGWAGVEGLFARQWLAAPLDDYLDFGVKPSVGMSYGHRSEVRLSFEATERDYDHDPALDATGAPIPGQGKETRRYDVRLVWRHHWDRDRRWRTTARVGWSRNEDNASGYFDFTRYQAGMELRWRVGRWEFSAEGRYARYDYPVQTVGGAGTPLRERDEVGAVLRAEYQLDRHFRWFANYEYERIFSNLELENYTVNTVSGGFSVEF
jgi:hypothetical protein